MMHHAIVDSICAYMSKALWNPIKEQNPFSSIAGAALRMDIVVRRGIRRGELFDVAVVNNLGPHHLEHARVDPGGAATHYERVKHAKYKSHADASDMKFTPLVVDMGGAWGALAIPALQDLARSYARQRGISYAAAQAMLFTSLSTVVHKHAARLCLSGLRGSSSRASQEA
jgi:hypothetical protein